MMNRLFPAAAVALFALSACQQKPETVTATAPDPQAACTFLLSDGRAREQAQAIFSKDVEPG